MPALTFWFSADFALANFLASRSFGNVSVALACVRFPGPSSNETYQVPLDLRAMMRRSRGYVGGDKPKLLGILHIAQRALRNLNRRQPDSFRSVSNPCHLRPQDSFSFGRCLDSLPA